MVRLPGAENMRSRDAMVILVESIPRQINSAAQLVCDYHRAGANIPRSRLWRTERHPATPLVIEYAGVPGGAKAARGWLRREQGHAWRLWTFEAEQWAMRVEVTLRDHGDWVALLKPPLIELYRSCLAPAITMRRPPEVAGKLIHMIETELALVAPGDQVAVIAAVHHRLALLSAHAPAA